MGERESNNQQAPSSRLGLRTAAGGGEIVEVQGGHIVRSTGRKDRHSKVCTAKGPRDRRVRLSAHTAIEFYDVQDRLGYDRPSKAVDWLIKKAKTAIDELDELPAWQPTATANLGTQKPEQEEVEDKDEEAEGHPYSKSDVVTVAVGSSKKPLEAEQSGSAYGFHQMDQQTSGSSSGPGPGFLPPSLDSDAIADTIKSFFPMASSASSIHLQNYPPDLLSRTSSQAQDLRLSLQSFQDPILLHHQHHHQQHHHHHQSQTPPSEQTFFSVTAPMTFDTASSSWSEQQQSIGRFHRMVAWNPADPAGGGGYVFNPGPQPAAQLLAQNQLFPQRGPLQSSNSPSVRAWAVDPATMADHPYLTHSSSATGFASGSFSGFRIPARIQGEEEDDGVGTRPASSASRH